MDLCAQSVGIKELFFRDFYSLKNKVIFYNVASNFGNINYKTELELKIFLLERENFELRGQLIDKMLII